MAKKQEKQPENLSKETLRDKIIQLYIKHLLINGKDPESIYVFCENNGMTESSFYDEFSSFETLQKEIWNGFITQTIATLHGTQEYNEYSVREKLLSFYFTFIEVLKQNRSFVLYFFQTQRKHELAPSFLKNARKSYLDFVNVLVEEGLQNGEFKKRPYLSEKYGDALWLQFLFLLRFWVNDESKSFESSDALIEKTVKLTFELLGESPLDSFIDLAKFLYQNK